MHARVARLAACAICVVAAASGCRRPPPSARAPDGAADALGERADGGATADGRIDTASDAASDAVADTEAATDSATGETSTTDAADAGTDLAPPDGPTDVPTDHASADAPADIAAGDAPPEVASDAPPDVPSGDAPADAPADTPAADTALQDASDARPEDQLCGSLGLQCRPYACDVARGICKVACLSDDDCVTGVHCNATHACGFREDTPCASNGECATGHCAQGVCCQTACNQRCYSCASLGSIGTCLPVQAGVPDPFGLCPTGTFCDGRSACIPASCTTDAECGTLHLCTNGHCVPCSATCVVDAECAAPAICVDRNFCTYCTLPDAGAGQ